MTQPTKKFEIEKNLYVLDSSGCAEDADAITGQVDAIFKSVEEVFDPANIERPASASPSSPSQPEPDAP